MAADRGAYICQRQSLNLFIENANFAKLTSMHFYGWKKGLKTGMYYLRTKAAADAIKFTVDQSSLKNPDKNVVGTPVSSSIPATAGHIENHEEEQIPVLVDKNMDDISCSLDNPEGCEACGS